MTPAARLRSLVKEATTPEGVMIQGNTAAAGLTRLAPQLAELVADMAEAATHAEDMLRAYGRGVELVGARHRLRAALLPLAALFPEDSA